MAFGLNRAELIGRLGADVTVNHLTSGGRVANPHVCLTCAPKRPGASGTTITAIYQ